MLITTAVSLFLAFWSLLFLVDFYLRAYDVKFYVDFADRIDLTISFFQLRFYTNRFHRSLLTQPLSGPNPSRFSIISRISSLWFAFGAAAALLCFCGITVYLTKLIWDELAKWAVGTFLTRGPLIQSVLHSSQPAVTSGSDQTRQHVDYNAALTPVVPGLNVPWGHVPLFLFVLVVAGIVHELGHALAAVDANVPVSGFGIFILAVYPGAFTELETESLGRSTPAQKMRIFGAGIWHNLVLALLGYFIFVGAPFLLSPFYLRNSGVLVLDVSHHSGLSGVAGLRRGHIVYALNGCGVRNIADWHTCIRELKSNHEIGYCLEEEAIIPGITDKVEVTHGELHCCNELLNVSLSHMCFRFDNGTRLRSRAVHSTGRVSYAPRFTESFGMKNRAERAIKVLPLLLPEKKYPGNRVINGSSLMSSTNTEEGTLNDLTRGKSFSLVEDAFACLPARYVTDQQVCNTSLGCSSLFGLKGPRRCVYPALFNGTTLLRLFVGNSSRSVLFVGSVDELIYYVKLSNFVPATFFAPPWFPNAVELFAKYLITFSLAMALLNAVPCFGLDGQFLSTTIVEKLFENWPPGQRRKLNSLVLSYGTVVLAMNVTIGVFRFFSPYFAF